MRIERWWWLGLFLVVSAGIHVLVGLKSPTFQTPVPPARTTEIEVALEPIREDPPKQEKPKPEPKPKPAPVKQPAAVRKPVVHPSSRPRTAVRPQRPAPQMAKSVLPTVPKPEAGGIDPKKEEKPLPLGLVTGSKSIPARIHINPAETPAKIDRPVPNPAIARTDVPDAPNVSAPKNDLKLAPRQVSSAASSDASRVNPFASANVAGDEKPMGPEKAAGAGAPRLTRMARNDISFAGGGSPSPAPTPGGKGGFKAPEAPKEDILYSNGGGRGGANLPKLPARTGGGGGLDFLAAHSDNPLAEKVRDEKAGLGLGTGGGQGVGAGGGLGSSRGQGVGTDPHGKVLLGLARGGVGPGLGNAASGRGTGTRPPGGGRGTGAELPGTGGTGAGYGSGTGVGFGNGAGAGLATGGGGRGLGRGPGFGGAGGGIAASGIGTRMALSRGIPFGDINGLLTGGSPNGGGGRGGGPGGKGSGAGGKSPSDGDDIMRMVYCLDSSGSMRDNNKIGKAKEALKKALSELKPHDWFKLIHFDGEVHVYVPTLLRATPENVTKALVYIDAIETRPGTNMSGALDQALTGERITHIFLLSDGKPSAGIQDPRLLRAMVKEKNQYHAQIITLALGVGEQFDGIPLLKGLAEDTEGKFAYVNLAK